MPVLLTLAALLAGGYAAWFTWDWRGSAHARHAAGREPYCDGGPSCSMRRPTGLAARFAAIGTAAASAGVAFGAFGEAMRRAVESAASFEQALKDADPFRR